MTRPAPVLSRLLPTLLLAAAVVAESPSFEVASIRPNTTGSGRSTEQDSPGRWTSINFTTTMLIQSAFGIRDYQISGGPGWLGDDKFDIAAITGTSRDLSDKELQPYLQSLLADRFRLKFHRETKELPVYSLVVAKNGTKLTAHPGEGDSSTQIRNNSGKSSVTSAKISMADFASTLGDRLDRLVIDNTALQGRYDLTLEWAPNPSPDSPEPSLFTALQEQLGLKLESTKGPVEIIVIDNIEKPSEN